MAKPKPAKPKPMPGQGTGQFGTRQLWDMVISGPVTSGHGSFRTSHFGT